MTRSSKNNRRFNAALIVIVTAVACIAIFFAYSLLWLMEADPVPPEELRRINVAACALILAVPLEMAVRVTLLIKLYKRKTPMTPKHGP
jgi:hypothetical protein